MKKGEKHLESTKKRIGMAHKGKLVSSESRIKMSLAKKGRPRKSFSQKTLQKMRGRVMPIELRKQISERQKGSKNSFWNGGTTKLAELIRGSAEYKLWRISVFKRDNYTCIWCGFKGYVEADHIKPFSLYPELRFAIDNGRTLCEPCHKTTDTYGNRVRKYQLN